LTANVAFWPHLMTLVMNRKAFDALTPGERAILRRAATVALPTEMSTLRTEQTGGTSSLCGRGLAFLRASRSERAGLLAAVKPVYHQLERDPETRSYINTIAELKRQTPPEPAPRCATSGRSVARAARSRLIGTWETKISL